MESGTGAASGVGVVAVTAEASLDGDLVDSLSDVEAGDDWLWTMGDADFD